MASHLAALVIFSFFVSIVFAVLHRDDPRSRVRLGFLLFGAFIASAIVAGWLMYPFPS